MPKTSRETATRVEDMGVMEGRYSELGGYTVGFETLGSENLGKIAEQYLKKGAKVYIEGQLQTRKYNDKDGVEKYSTEVVLQNYRGELTMLDGRNGSESAGLANGDDFGQSGPMDRPRPAAAKPQSFVRDLDDEVPF